MGEQDHKTLWDLSNHLRFDVSLDQEATGNFWHGLELCKRNQSCSESRQGTNCQTFISQHGEETG